MCPTTYHCHPEKTESFAREGLPTKAPCTHPISSGDAASDAGPQFTVRGMATFASALAFDPSLTLLSVNA